MSCFTHANSNAHRVSWIFQQNTKLFHWFELFFHWILTIWLVKNEEKVFYTLYFYFHGLLNKSFLVNCVEYFGPINVEVWKCSMWYFLWNFFNFIEMKTNMTIVINSFSFLWFCWELCWCGKTSRRLVL